MIVILTVTALLGVKLATFAVMALTTEQDCTFEELKGCLESLMSVAKHNDLTFAATRLQLTAVCSSLKESVRCVDEHMNLCFDPTQRKVYNHVVSGARQVLSEMCVPGPIQEAYLAHAPCFINITLDEEKCAPKYRHLIEMSETVNKEQSVDEGLKDSCCAFREFVLCKYIYVSRDCDSEANVFLQQYLDRITSSLLHEHCAHYTYGDSTCTSASNNLRFIITFPIILTFSFSIFGMNPHQIYSNQLL